MLDVVDLEARVCALELVVVTQLLQSSVARPGFDPRLFAASRRDAWTAIGRAACDACTTEDEEKRFTQAYAAALERLGHLLVELAEPVQEAIEEVTAEARAEQNA